MFYGLMKNTCQITLENANQVFKAFADETRLRIFHLLIHAEEICVNDIENALEIPQSKVSRHLAYLKNSGLIVFRKEGQWIFYSVIQPATCLEREMFNCVKRCFKTVPLLQDDLKRLKGGPKCC